MMAVAGLEFKAAWNRRATSSYRGEMISILGLEDLIHAKKTTSRDSDKLDLRLLEEAKKGKTQ
jgi:hypothetical protein